MNHFPQFIFERFRPMMSDPKPAPEEEEQEHEGDEGGEHEDPPPEQQAATRTLYSRPKRTRQMKPDRRPGGYQTR
jgi:hypothetical protein